MSNVTATVLLNADNLTAIINGKPQIERYTEHNWAINPLTDV